MSEAPSAHPSEDNVNYIVWFDFFSYFFLLKVFPSLNVHLYLKSSPSLHWKQQNVIPQRHCLLKYNLYHAPVLFGLLCGESHWSSEPFVSVESLEISLSCLWVTKQQRIHLWVICRYGSNSLYASKCAVLTEDNVPRPVWYFIARKNAREKLFTLSSSNPTEVNTWMKQSTGLRQEILTLLFTTLTHETSHLIPPQANVLSMN